MNQIRRGSARRLQEGAIGERERIAVADPGHRWCPLRNQIRTFPTQRRSFEGMAAAKRICLWTIGAAKESTLMNLMGDPH
jgi:hypothetical protein